MNDQKKKFTIYSNLGLFSVSVKGDASLIRPFIRLNRVKLKTRLTEQCSVFFFFFSLRTPGLLEKQPEKKASLQFWRVFIPNILIHLGFIQRSKAVMLDFTCSHMIAGCQGNQNA